MSARGEVAVELVTYRHDDRLVHYVSARIPWWVARLARDEVRDVFGEVARVSVPWSPPMFAAIDRAASLLKLGEVARARLWVDVAHAYARALAAQAVHAPGRCLCGRVLDRSFDAACRHCRRLAAESGEVGS